MKKKKVSIPQHFKFEVLRDRNKCRYISCADDRTSTTAAEAARPPLFHQVYAGSRYCVGGTTSDFEHFLDFFSSCCWSHDEIFHLIGLGRDLRRMARLLFGQTLSAIGLPKDALGTSTFQPRRSCKKSQSSRYNINFSCFVSSTFYWLR